MNNKISGDVEQFDNNWNTRQETFYEHWNPDEPKTQIQLAFRRHFETFSKILSERKIVNGKILEVGCGRGTLSTFFANSGWQCSLLDASAKVIEIAADRFRKFGFNGEFFVDNAEDMKLPSDEFQAVFSIGLLEHFENPKKVLKEQIRVLAPGGCLLCYIVPQKNALVQDEFKWLSEFVLAFEKENKNSKPENKEFVYRTSYDLEFYKKLLISLDLENIETSGIYSTPMISSSSEFPFSLLPTEAEKALTKFLTRHLDDRIAKFKDPWLCEENYGNAILVWGTKPK